MKADVEQPRALKAHAGPRFVRLGVFATTVTAWLTACRSYYAASSRYEDLSRLSDAELERRGLTRTTLGRHACEAGDRADRCSR
jgi:hypothetical protein